MGKKFALFMISFVFGISAFMVAPAQTEASVTETVKCIYLINKVKGREAELERRQTAYTNAWYSEPMGPKGIQQREETIEKKKQLYLKALKDYNEAASKFLNSCSGDQGFPVDTNNNDNCDFENGVWNSVAQNVADSVDPKKGFDGNGMAEGLAGTTAETIPAAIDQMGQNHANLGGCSK